MKRATRTQRVTVSLDEKRLLKRIQIRFMVWILIAIVSVEILLMGGTLLIFRKQRLEAAKQIIIQEWTHKSMEAIQDIQASFKQSEPVTSVDTDPETVATWIVTAQGKVLKKDEALAFAPVFLDTSMVSFIHDLQNPLVNSWVITHIANVPILIGSRSLYLHGRYVGYLVSAYSLMPSESALQTLLQIDLMSSPMSLVIILPITYTLSKKSLSPVRRALQRQRNFVSDASHEFRTPLTILRATLELMRDESDPRNLDTAIHNALEETDYLSGLVANLSVLARLESGTISTTTRVNLTKIVCDTSEAIKKIANQREITITCHPCELPVFMFGEPARLRQLLMILLENAVKYNSPGGNVTIEMLDRGHSVSVIISDNGIGIPEQDLPYVFDRFYRSGQARQHAPGSGIGLAVAAWIVNLYRGRIEVVSQVGTGTTFTVSFPTVH